MKNPIEDFVHQMKVSIDIRIRRMEKQLSDDLMLMSSPRPDFNPLFIIERNDNMQFLERIEEHSTSIGKLLFLRSSVNRENIPRIMKILDNNFYQKWSRKDLEQFIAEPPHSVHNSQSVHERIDNKEEKFKNCNTNTDSHPPKTDSAKPENQTNSF